MSRGVHVELVGIDDDLALRLLGRVHGHVGTLQQLPGVRAVVGGNGDAAAGADGQLDSVDLERFLEHGHDPLSDANGVLTCVDVGQQDTELVTTQSGHQVACP